MGIHEFHNNAMSVEINWLWNGKSIVTQCLERVENTLALVKVGKCDNNDNANGGDENLTI